MKRTLVSMTDAMSAWLESEASRRGCPVTQVIRDLVAGAMRHGHNEGLTDEQRAAIDGALRGTSLPRFVTGTL
jgi:hypothetical protein